MLLTLMQYSRFYKLDYEKQKLQTELKSLKDYNEQIKIRISMESDLPFIYEYATQTLKMVFPDRIIYIHE